MPAQLTTTSARTSAAWVATPVTRPGDAHTAHARAACQRRRRVDRVGPPVLRQIHRAHDIVDCEQRPALTRFARGEDLDLETVAACHRSAALQLLEPWCARCDRHRADLAKAGRLAGLALEPFIELGRVLGETGEIVSGAQLPDEPRGMPGRAAGQLPPLEQQYVAAAAPGEMVGDAAADDAAADDDDARVRRDALHPFPQRGGVSASELGDRL